MKLKYIDGCVKDMVTIDGRDLSDMEKQEIKEVLYKLIDKETSIGVLQNIFIDLLMSLGKYNHVGICEACGDSINTYTLTL